MNDLKSYLANLRQQKPDCTVPDFDPSGPLEDAKYLFLLMKPGTKGAGENNVVSLAANDDQTARNMRELFAEIDLGIHDVLLWNVCPWYNGERKITASEVRDGFLALETLLPLLPKLRSVVLVGKDAHKAEKFLKSTELKVITSPHPSPLVRNINPKLYAEIAPAWARILK